AYRQPGRPGATLSRAAGVGLPARPATRVAAIQPGSTLADAARRGLARLGLPRRDWPAAALRSGARVHLAQPWDGGHWRASCRGPLVARAAPPARSRRG